jgi:hypothetical protein
MEEGDNVKSDQVDEHRRAHNRNRRKGSLSNRKGCKKRKPESQGRRSTKLTSVTPSEMTPGEGVTPSPQQPRALDYGSNHLQSPP